ncbi:MAG: sigma-54 interaction domain-containing protein [Acidithiobacillus sp.]
MTQMTIGWEALCEVLPELLDTMDSGILLTDIQGKIEFSNTSAKALLGVNELEHLRKIPGDSIQKEMIKAAIAAGQDDAVSRPQTGCVRWDHCLPVPDGRDKILQMRTRLVERKQQKLRIFFIEDVSELRHAERILGSTRSVGFITDDPIMRDALELIEQVAVTDASVIFQGESGSGKGLMVRMLHQQSSRAKKPLIEVNCAAIPDNLFEAEFFGSVKGAFTGAVSDRIGRFAAADGGTLFLDEVSELSKHHQAKLLKVLEDMRYEPIGSTKTQKVDVRVVAASNRNLKDLVENGDFRSDLFYRLNVIPIRIPALRERPFDIILLAEHFLKITVEGRKKTLGPQARHLLLDYPWPGNVRELRNVMEYVAICSTGSEIDDTDFPKDFMDRMVAHGTSSAASDHYDSGNAYSKDHLVALLQKHGGNRAAAARELGIDRVTLWRHLSRLGISGKESSNTISGVS